MGTGIGAGTERFDEAKQFQLLVGAVTDYAIYMIDLDGIVVTWNPGAERIKGYAEHEVVGKHFSIFYTPEERAAGEPERAMQRAAAEGRYESESWRVRKDGTRFWANAVLDAIRDDSGNLVGFAKVTRDVTRQRDAREALERARLALFQAQKMEVIGQLTGGVAHDFNNMLTVISNNLDLLTRNPQGPRERRLIDIAQRAAERCSRLTEQLLAFARRQPLRPEPHSANYLIGSFEAVLRRACGEAVEVEIDFDPELRSFSVDSQQFKSTLLNLAFNARDAMQNGGTLRITTRNADIDANAAARQPEARPGPYVVITVEDTGHGMAPEIASRAIEPFFTTKDVGKGSGLGLSQVYGFVAQSGGFVDISSEVGIGTTVRLYLPALLEGASTPSKKVFEGGERLTVLAVEDDPDVLEATVETLESLGYHVLTANDGASALTSLQRDVHIDILFTDVVMPKGMNGVQLAREARRLRPNLRILLASGYPMGALSANHGLNSEFAFLAKPYRWPDLEEKLRNLSASR